MTWAAGCVDRPQRWPPGGVSGATAGRAGGLMLVLDSGGVSHLARRDRQAAALLHALRRRGLWPAVVPTVVLAESLTGSPQRDANVNRFLKACDVRPAVSERMARRAGVSWIGFGADVVGVVVVVGQALCQLPLAPDGAESEADVL